MVSNGEETILNKRLKQFIANSAYELHVLGSRIIRKSRIQVLSVDETIRRIREQNLSVIRFGDGEINLIRGISVPHQGESL